MTRLTRAECESLIETGKQAADRRDFKAAIEAWTKCLPDQRGNASLYAGVGNCYLELHNHSQAIQHYRVAVNIDPTFVPGVIGYADALILGGKPEKALVHLHKTRRTFKDGTSDYGIYLGCKANAQKALGKYALAQDIFAEALALAPGYSSLWTSSGNLMTLEGRHEEAGMCYKKALELAPSTVHYINYSSHLLNIGRWGEAWAVHEARLRDPNSGVGSREKPWWNGRPFSGRLAVFTEQGHGDFIMFSRYLQQLQWKVSGTVTLVCDPTQIGLARHMQLPCRVVDTLFPSEFDVQCALLSLPFLLDNPDPRKAPAAVAMRVTPWRFEKRPAVNLVWYGNPANPNDAIRSLPLRYFAPLVRGLPEVSWFTTSPESYALEEIRRLGLPIEQHVGTWVQTAEKLAGADAMLTVETGPAHLAGTLGLPCVTLISDFHDWRWGRMLGETTTPWYRGTQLVRQDNGEPWEVVMKRAAKDLRAVLFSEPSQSREAPVRS